MELFISILVYLYIAFCTMAISYKTGNENIGWFAFIPLLNVFLIIKMADLSILTILLLFIPIVNYVFIAFCYMRISAFIGLSPIWGLLMFIPGINLFAIGYAAFSNTSY